MRKCDFNNRMSLRGEQESSTWQSQQNKLIDRDPHVSPLDFFRMTTTAVILEQQRVTRVSEDIKRPHGSSPWVTMEESPRVRKCPIITILMWILTSSVSMSNTVKAVCTPTPDCAAIGYTESSCDGKFTRCPFDTSKLFCVPCDSAYRYTCTGDYATRASGTACQGKYAGCECVAGAVLGETTYECDTSCSVGNIFYSDGSCSSCLDNEKTPVGIFVRNNSVIVAISIPDITWSENYLDITNLTNHNSETDVRKDFNGYYNTNSIISHYGTSVSASNNAAVYCYNYAPFGFENTMNQWYLPSGGELIAFLYDNFDKIKKSWDIIGTSINDAWFGLQVNIINTMLGVYIWDGEVSENAQKQVIHLLLLVFYIYKKENSL